MASAAEKQRDRSHRTLSAAKSGARDRPLMARRSQRQQRNQPEIQTVSRFLLQLQQVHAVHVQSLARAEDRNDDGQSDRCFRRRHHHHKENEYLPAERLPVRGEGHEGQDSRR